MHVKSDVRLHLIPTPPVVMPNYANILRAVRKHHHFTQEKAVEIFPFSLSTLQRIEAGKRDLTHSELELIAQFCGKSVPELLQIGEGPIEESEVPGPAPTEKEERWEKIIAAQNEQISSLLEEIKNLYSVLKRLISGGGAKCESSSKKDSPQEAFGLTMRRPPHPSRMPPQPCGHTSRTPHLLFEAWGCWWRMSP
ncbi:MAG: helix-turn-helix transcriptional regulator [Saprospiraceae bacterium]|nr:helix-turn-helix transcriptional regulator [Saprospiraceae bacterium]